jgi:NTE family protein
VDERHRGARVVLLELLGRLRGAGVGRAVAALVLPGGGVLAGEGLDEVFVIAPMVSFTSDEPAHWRARMERAWRERVTRRCLHEVAKLHATGTEVTVLGPGPEDLEGIGGNLMDVARRRHVLETSLRTSAAALADPRSLTPPLSPHPVSPPVAAEHSDDEVLASDRAPEET